MMGFELDRTVSNSIELRRHEKSDENTMNYDGWSKLIELDRTLTPNFSEPREFDEALQLREDSHSCPRRFIVAQPELPELRHCCPSRVAQTL